MDQARPLATLARENCETVAVVKECVAPAPVAACAAPCGNNNYGGKVVGALILWVILAIIIFLILLAAKPNWVQVKDSQGNPTGTVNTCTAILAAVVISFFVIVVIAIIWALVAADY